MDSLEPDISIIIPAHNEEKNIAECIRSIHNAALNISNFRYEIIVVLNRCTDKTGEIAETLGAKTINNETKNLSCIRNAGVAESLGEIVVTIDADSQMSENLLRDINNVMKTKNFIGGGALILPQRWSLGIFVTGLLVLGLLLYYRVSVGIFFCRREDFKKIGGFNEEMFSAEDIDFAKRLRALGRERKLKYKHILKSYILTSCRKFDIFGDWYFISNPLKTISLIKGKNQKQADLWWYDVKR